MPNGIEHIGKFLIVAGVIIVLLSGLLLASSKLDWAGRLPGDILIRKKNFTFYFPITTGILLSLILTLVFWLAGRR
jgi:hypothetical protein